MPTGLLGLVAPSEVPSFGEIARVLTLRAGYNTTLVLIAAALLGVASGVVGSFALLRKRALVADALSHATLPGICLAFLAATGLGLHGRSIPVLLAGAAVSAVVGVLCIQWLSRRTRLTEDAAIGIVLSVFFGVGVVLLSVIQQSESGEQGGLKGFILGQTAAISRADAILLGAIAIVAIVVVALLHKELRLVCFNDEFAAVGGWPVGALDLVMMALVVIITVAGLQAVGIILVVALLIIPAAAARFWTERLLLMVVLSGLIGGLSGYVGASASALLPRKPAGAVIVLTAGAAFGVSMLLAPRRGVIAAGVRRVRVSVRIARDHVLKAMLEAGVPERGSDVARRLGWSAWTTGALLLAMRMRGLTLRDHRGHSLAVPGRTIAERLVRNHRLWEQYLVTRADIAASHVDWSADMVEHVLSEELVGQLERQLQAGAAENGR